MKGNVNALRRWSATRRSLREKGAIHDRFASYTMVPRAAYIANLELADRVHNLRGAIVECGTWRGGMIAGIAELLGPERSYCLFDSFQGLPPAQMIDGEAALKWQANTQSPAFYDNCYATVDEASAVLRMANVLSPQIYEGWFSDTLPTANFPDGIAFLRLDADWYESTMQILDNLFHLVNDGGYVVVDDYYTWDGCATALHQFLSNSACTERLRVHKGVCYLVKHARSE